MEFKKTVVDFCILETFDVINVKTNLVVIVLERQSLLIHIIRLAVVVG